MWFKFLISLFVTLWMAGCAADVQYPEVKKPLVSFHADKNLPKDQREKLEKAAKTWESQTDGLAKISFIYDYEEGKDFTDKNILTVRSEYDEDVVEFDCTASEDMGLPPGLCVPVVLAWVSPGDGIHDPRNVPVSFNIIPSRYPTEAVWQSVLIHEMGHVLGLPHSNFQQAVMYPTNDASKTCLKQADLTAFCAANVCTGHTMHPCE